MMPVGSAQSTKFASSVISQPLAVFFTSVVRHGYMPACIHDCVMTPLLKGSKNPLCSENYRPIALASCLSKVLEHLILHKYSSYLQSSHLQFGFKSGCSTTLCTGIVKNIVSRYISRGSSVWVASLRLLTWFVVCHHQLFGLCHPGIMTSKCVFVGSNHTLIFLVSNGVRQRQCALSHFVLYILGWVA